MLTQSQIHDSLFQACTGLRVEFVQHTDRVHRLSPTKRWSLRTQYLGLERLTARPGMSAEQPSRIMRGGLPAWAALPCRQIAAGAAKVARGRLRSARGLVCAANLRLAIPG